MKSKDWNLTGKRFVAFFDILGFKDLVQNNTHKHVLGKLELLKTTLAQLGNLGTSEQFKSFNLDDDQTKSVTFSDSIIFFSKGESNNDLLKIIADSYGVWLNSLKNGIAIKGAISFGEITANFKESLFFGQPIIDAYLLHEELQMLTVIFDHNFEKKVKELKGNSSLGGVLTEYKANLKSGKIKHTLMRPQKEKSLKDMRLAIQELYYSTSGRPRMYLDNTIEFLSSLSPS